MKSYAALDDEVNGQGCLQHVIGVVVLIAVITLLASCAGGPPTFKADIVRSDGKLTHRVNGTVQDNKPWLERYAGPMGALLSGIGYALSGGIVAPAP